MIGRFPGRWTTGFFSFFLDPPETQVARPFSFGSTSGALPDTERGEEEDEDDEEEDGGLAMDSMPWMASRVLGEAGASSLENKIGSLI